MKADYDQLEKWAANPDRTSFPAIWQTLATRYPVPVIINGENTGRTLDGEDWAQQVYKNLYGKDLPPVTGTGTVIRRIIKETPKYWHLSRVMDNKRGQKEAADLAGTPALNNPENTYGGIS